jgi:hypothetical protein
MDLKNNTNNNGNNNSNNNDHAYHPNNTSLINNLVSRTLGNISSLSNSDPLSSSTPRTTEKLVSNPIIMPALTPDMLPNSFTMYSEEDGPKRMEDRPEGSARVSVADLSNLDLHNIRITSPSTTNAYPPILHRGNEYSKILIHPIITNQNQSGFTDNTHNDDLTTRVSDSHSLRHRPGSSNRTTLRDDLLYTSLSTRTKGTKKSTTAAAPSSTNITIQIGRIVVQARISKPLSEHFFPSSKNTALTSSKESQSSFLSLKDYLRDRSEGKY